MKKGTSEILGFKILKFYREGWPEGYTELRDCDPDHLNSEGEIELNPLSTYDLDTFGVIIEEGEEGERLPSGVSFKMAFYDWCAKKEQGDPRRKNRKYPYDYAADLLCGVLPEEGTMGSKLERTDAIQLIEELAVILQTDFSPLSEMMADYYLTHMEEVLEAAARQAAKARG